MEGKKRKRLGYSTFSTKASAEIMETLKLKMAFRNHPQWGEQVRPLLFLELDVDISCPCEGASLILSRQISLAEDHSQQRSIREQHSQNLKKKSFSPEWGSGYNISPPTRSKLIFAPIEMRHYSFLFFFFFICSEFCHTLE